jgi:hypothetical protein
MLHYSSSLSHEAKTIEAPAEGSSKPNPLVPGSLLDVEKSPGGSAKEMEL